MMKKAASVLALLAALGLPAGATESESLGTKEEAIELADRLAEIVDEKGLTAAISSLFDPELPFASSRMGVNLFDGPFVVGDNREPEMVASDYSETPDLTGVPVWPRISSAAAKQSDVVLKWYHYDTQEIYDFHCYSRQASNPQYTIMVCR